MSEAIAITEVSEPGGGTEDGVGGLAPVADGPAADLPERTLGFYRSALEARNAAGVPYLVAGAYAFARFTGIERHTKDFDIFVRQEDEALAHRVLSGLGCEIEHFSPHWLSKATCGADFIDIIHSSGNAVAEVDERWIAHAVEDEVLGVPVRLCPVEEMIWSKAFIMERERFDGADVAHLLHACGAGLDWQRLIDRFDEHWRVLFAHLVLFGFIYPDRRDAVPRWVTDELAGRVRRESEEPPADKPRPGGPVCRGTLVSRSQYLYDVEHFGYRDGRLAPSGTMSRWELDRWRERTREEVPEAEAVAHGEGEGTADGAGRG
jgi:hypothetical protein